jgi:hypothetical protein
MAEIRQKAGTPGSPRTCEDRGLFLALELVGANFNSGPSHPPFWVIKETCRGLIIDFVSLLFSRVTDMLGFRLPLGIVQQSYDR